MSTTISRRRDMPSVDLAILRPGGSPDSRQAFRAFRLFPDPIVASEDPGTVTASANGRGYAFQGALAISRQRSRRGHHLQSSSRPQPRN